MAETEYILDRDTVIGGLPCARDTEAVLYGEDRPRIVTLSRATRIGSIPCAAGSRLFLHPNGRVCNARLWRKVEVNGVSLSKGSRVTLRPEGELLEYSTQLSVDRPIQEIPCRGGHWTWFYREGRLSRGVLSKKHRFGRRMLPAGTTFTLGADGSLIESTPPPPRGKRYKERLYGAVEIPGL
jgi:hypothetical protein